MVSVTISVPKKIKEKMNQFPEMNWSGFVRKQIIEKTAELSERELLFKKLKKEQGLTKWSVRLQDKARKERYEALKKKKLL